jgi:hypothetical protein
MVGLIIPKGIETEGLRKIVQALLNALENQPLPSSTLQNIIKAGKEPDPNQQ